MTVANDHKDLCRMCGACCFLKPKVTLSDVEFIPVASIAPGLEEEHREMLSLYVCKKFNIEKSECSDYNNRPVSCRKFHCKGEPRPMVIDIVGVPESE